MIWSFVLAGSSVALFILHAIVCELEWRRGQRLFLTGVRAYLDRLVIKCYVWGNRKFTYVTKHIVTLSWYYSLHAFLVAMLRFIAGIYNFIEGIVLRNRDKAKKIRVEQRQSHLTAIADHQEATALSPRQKAQRKKSALEGRS